MYELYQNLWASMQYGESRLSILFIWRVTTLRIVCNGESLWTAWSQCGQQGVVFFNIEGLPLPYCKRDSEANN
jgi:hypothetical protein